jgi:hypothetical protein
LSQSQAHLAANGCNSSDINRNLVLAQELDLDLKPAPRAAFSEEPQKHQPEAGREATTSREVDRRRTGNIIP